MKLGLTNQEVFDKVAEYLLNQKERSVRQSTYAEVCLYRGPNGNKCAIGFLIPDELATADLDGNADSDVSGIMRDFPQIKEFFEGVDEELLSGLQHTHDHTAMRSRRQKLAYVAEKHGLDKSVLTRVQGIW
jgi:hypothetical protein